jgi:hypothetical protein
MKRYIRILVDDENVEGDVFFTNAFNDQDAIWRLDILQDVIGILSTKYNATLDEMYKDFDDANPQRPKAETH